LGNTRIYGDNLIEVVRQIKQASNTNILVLGSGLIIQQLAEEGLIDEYIFIVSPVAAGKGKALFPFVKLFDLTLREAKTFESGNVVLHYLLKKRTDD